jgi:Tol biopolymer transport system component
VAYVRETAGKQSLWLKQLATDRDVEIATLGEEICFGLAFSLDGSYVYFERQEHLKPTGDLYQVPSLGGTPRKVLKEISGPPAFSPDGQRVAFVRYIIGEFSLLTASLDGSGERVLASYKLPELIVPERAAWSPDGKTLAFFLYSSHPVLTTIAAEGGQAQPVAGPHLQDIVDLTWLPGGRHLVVAGRPGPSGPKQLYEVSLEGGEARQITHGLSEYTAVGVSADGKSLLALQHQTLATLQVATPGKEPEARTLSAGNQNLDGWWGLAWTPDGKVVYSSVPNGRADLWEMGADGSNPQRLTSNDASSESIFPAVSLGGSFIAFTQQDRTGQLRIWRMDMDGGNLKRLTEGKLDQPPAISPDGRWVVFDRVQGGKWFLMKVPSGGGPASQLTDYVSYFPSVSPDGKWIACLYSPGQNKPRGLAIVPFAGGQAAKVFPLPATVGFSPIVWTPDGRAISYINDVNGAGNIWEQPVAGGPPKPVTHFTSDQIFWFDWSRDGRLALSRGAEPTDAVLIKNFR